MRDRRPTPTSLRQIGFALLLTSVAVGIPIESLLIELDFDALTALPVAVLATLVSTGLFF